MSKRQIKRTLSATNPIVVCGLTSFCIFRGPPWRYSGRAHAPCAWRCRSATAQVPWPLQRDPPREGMCCVGRTRERAVDMASHHTPPTCVSLSWPRLAFLASRGMRRLLEHGRVVRGGGALPRHGSAGVCGPQPSPLPVRRARQGGGHYSCMHAGHKTFTQAPPPDHTVFIVGTAP
jgi:hypothetical protein